MKNHSFELEQDFLAHISGAWTAACSCGWTGECWNSVDEARDQWMNHVEQPRCDLCWAVFDTQEELARHIEIEEHLTYNVDGEGYE